jgi:hypothetical protein
MSRTLAHATWPDGEEFDANRHLTMMGMSFRHHLGCFGEHGLAFSRCEKSPENLVANEVRRPA